jgi:hypothetical protein
MPFGIHGNETRLLVQVLSVVESVTTSAVIHTNEIVITSGFHEDKTFYRQGLAWQLAKNPDRAH